MRAKEGARTFTESARRAQIVRSAIETIAEHGYGSASFTRIAKHAGLSSTGMISYHFAGKDDLIREVVAETITVADGFIRPRMEATSGYLAQMRVRLASNLELVRAHPNHVRALVEIMTNARTAQGTPVVGPGPIGERARLFTQHLEDGQRAGEFGEFDPHAMALAIIGAIDANVGALCEDPSLDAELYGRHLADTFERATRPAP